MSATSMDQSDLSPGQEFAAACAARGTQARVDFQTTITDLFPGFKRRPRIAVRALFKVVRATRDPMQYWFETQPQAALSAPLDDLQLRPEAAFEFHFGEIPLRPTTAWIQIPPPLLDDSDGLAAFIDYRLLVRLCTAENQALARGRGGDRVLGLLQTPGITRLPAQKDPISSVLAACNRVEQMGGSADGILINPADYYQYLVGHGSLLSDLAGVGVRIARARMVDAGTFIVGDFTAAATIFDSGRSVIRFAEPPPGVFQRAGLAVCGEIYEALCVHLPTHFFVASLRP